MMKIYGPYSRKDGRQHIIYVVDGKRTTQSYPRYIMESYLGRELTTDETVDHIDNNPQNNNINNLQILSRRDNALKSVKYADYIVLTCRHCGKQFERRKAIHKRNMEVRKVDGPFCSKQCVGKVHH